MAEFHSLKMRVYRKTFAKSLMKALLPGTAIIMLELLTFYLPSN